jgi:hypothetical protein
MRQKARQLSKERDTDAANDWYGGANDTDVITKKAPLGTGDGTTSDSAKGIYLSNSLIKIFSNLSMCLSMYPYRETEIYS